MPAATAQESQQHVAGLDVLVNGAAMDPKWRDATTEVRVVDTLALPDMAVVKLLDPQGENVDTQPFQLGAEIEVKAGAIGDRSTKSIFKGQIAAVEPEFTKKGCMIVARAYDKSHKLIRVRKTRTFQQVSASDMIRKIAGDSGLSADVESTNVVHEFFQQSNETDWDFAWRLALMHDFEVDVKDTKLSFRKANKGDEGTVALKYQESMISFRPRMSGVQQPQTVNVRAWDPKGKQVVNGSAASSTTSSQAGVQRSKIANDLGAARPRSPTASRSTTARLTRSRSRRSTAWPTRSSRPTASPSATRRSRRAARSRCRASVSSSPAPTRSRARRTLTAAPPAIRPRSRSPAGRAARCSS